MRYIAAYQGEHGVVSIEVKAETIDDVLHYLTSPSVEILDRVPDEDGLTTLDDLRLVMDQDDAMEPMGEFEVRDHIWSLWGTVG
jgi:hypothetical protein